MMLQDFDKEMEMRGLQTQLVLRLFACLSGESFLIDLSLGIAFISVVAVHLTETNTRIKKKEEKKKRIPAKT